jgi:hypothetical protein
VTLYESLIKVDVTDDPSVRIRDIKEGLAYTAVMLIDEYGLSFDAVSDALADAQSAAEDEWYNLHPSEDE